MGGGMDPRQMSMMMKKLGIDVRDIEGVQEVVVRTASRDYVFSRATVSVMKAQGTETWQVSGKPRIVEHGAPGTPASSSASPAATPVASPATGTATAPPAVLDISSEDIALVMKETGRSHAEAKAALEATQGDLAEAILKLSQA